MKRLAVFVLLLSLVVAATAQGPVSPLRLKVSEMKKRDTKPRSGYSESEYYSRSRSGHVVTYYSIELSQAAKTVEDIVVKWAVLIKPKDAKALRVVEGEKKCSLDVGAKVTVDTDTFETASVTSSATGGYYSGSTSSSRTPGDEVLGYSVEVFVKGERVAADSKPLDVKNRIDQVRAVKRGAE